MSPRFQLLFFSGVGRRSKPTVKSRPVLTRRQFLQIVAASAGAAVTGTELLSSAADLNRRYQEQLPEKN